MTNDQIRIAVAELCGWTQINATLVNRGGEPVGFSPHIKGPAIAKMQMVPNYPFSLDACAEFEKNAQEGYFQELGLRCGAAFQSNPDIAVQCAATATPLQRCEAFLKLHNKWKEDKV